MTFRKYLVLAGISVFATVGDSLLARGMKELGNVNISLHNLSFLLLAILNPWVTSGILFLVAFFSCYMSALSWADLT
ncbi:MAG: EamA family transporter, partial [Terriglobales bacterium]